MPNKDTYERNDVVKSYSKKTNLQLPEKTILSFIGDNLSEMKMLDIGIGGGRTTLHFAKLVKEYVGIDYSEKMVNTSKKLYYKYSKNISFKVCDARSMKMFKKNTFDFILFSFNGIDYVSHNDRLKILREINRVGKPGGYFCFSTHNIQASDRIFKFAHQLNKHPKILFKNIIKWLLICFIKNKYSNIKKIKYSQYAIFNDGAHKFKLQTYYIKPIEQIKQLINNNFSNIQIFSLNSGNEIKNEIELNNTYDAWLYYLCIIKK
jgi:ubiquinone/menaquinone biosynthesis C-methylase UbiE